MAKYVPPVLSRVVKETGAHYICVIKKAVERGVRADDYAGLRALADECAREEKLVPVVKLLKRWGVR